MDTTITEENVEDFYARLLGLIEAEDFDAALALFNTLDGQTGKVETLQSITKEVDHAVDHASAPALARLIVLTLASTLANTFDNARTLASTLNSVHHLARTLDSAHDLARVDILERAKKYVMFLIMALEREVERESRDTAGQAQPTVIYQPTNPWSFDHIFVSYSSKDREGVTGLIGDLKALECQVWFDQVMTSRGGHKWWKLILEQIRAADLFIFALTPNALKSLACSLEYRYATALHKRVLPVMLGEVNMKTVPLELRALQMVDYREQSKAQMLTLISTLRNLPPLQPMPDPLPDEPDVPVEEVDQIRIEIDAPGFNPEKQKALIRRIEDLHEKEETDRDELIALCDLMLQHEEITVTNAKRIQRMIADMRG